MCASDASRRAALTRECVWLRALAIAGGLEHRSMQSSAVSPSAALCSRAVMRGRSLATATSRAAIRAQVTKVPIP